MCASEQFFWPAGEKIVPHHNSRSPATTCSTPRTCVRLEHMSEIVRFSCSGTLVAVWRVTLDRLPANSPLLAFLDSNPCVDSSNGGIFLDADPAHFTCFLNWLRHGSLFVPNSSDEKHVCELFRQLVGSPPPRESSYLHLPSLFASTSLLPSTSWSALGSFSVSNTTTSGSSAQTLTLPPVRFKSRVVGNVFGLDSTLLSQLVALTGRAFLPEEPPSFHLIFWAATERTDDELRTILPHLPLSGV